MKKIFRLLLLAFFSCCFFSSSKVSAAEIDTSKQNLNPTIRTVADGIGPLSNYETTVSLDQGESFELTRKFLFYNDTMGKFPLSTFTVGTLDRIPKTFSLEVTVPDCENIESSQQFFFTDFVYFHNFFDYRPDPPEVYDVIFKLTNYSSPTVTYYVNINFEYTTRW